MSSPSVARAAALQALLEVGKNARYVRDALRFGWAGRLLDARDRKLAWRLAMGATAASGFLEKTIRSVSQRALHLERPVLLALELSTFELLYLSTPIPVAVSEGVALVRSQRPKATGLANALLRKIAPYRERVRRAQARLRAAGGTDEDLEWISGLPRWLLDELTRSLRKDAKADFCSCVLQPAPSWGAFFDKDDEAFACFAAKADLCPTPLPATWRIDRLDDLAFAESGAHGFIRSDLAAQMVAALTTPARHGSRLEIGLGRGTKTLIVALDLARRNDVASLVGVERDPRRLIQARERFERLALDVETFEGDARELDAMPALSRRTFDLVFLDAPCTGSGTLRRHPEIQWSLSPAALDPDDPHSLIALQAELLASAAQYVAPGGSLAYSTCSVLRQENDAQIDAFLESDEGSYFAPISCREVFGYQVRDASLQARIDTYLTSRGRFQSLPIDGGPDGHYLAFLKRRDVEAP